MKPEDIKRSWQMLNRKIDELDERTIGMAQNLAISKSQSLQQRLGKRYRAQALWGFLLPVLAPLMVWIDLPLWVGIAYGLAGVVLGVINLRFSSFISNIDYNDMPIVDAMSHAVKVLRRQMWVKRVGYLLGMLIVAPLMYEIWRLGEPDLFVSACTGGVIGGVIGLYKQRVNSRIARQLVKTLENDIKQ